MTYDELPEKWKEHYGGKFPAGRDCQKCGNQIPLTEATYTKNCGGRIVMDRFCRDCMRAYRKARGRPRTMASFRKTRQVHRTAKAPVATEQGQGLRPLPVLQLGKRYRIDGEYTGRVVAIQGSNYLVETRTGIRCFTVGQLVGVEIKEA